MPIHNHTLTSSSTCNFSFITGKLNSLKHFRARENRYGRHAVLNLTGNTFSKIGHKVGNISGTIRLYHYLRMNSVFFSFFFIIVPVIYPFLLSNCRKKYRKFSCNKRYYYRQQPGQQTGKEGIQIPVLSNGQYIVIYFLPLFCHFPVSEWVSDWICCLTPIQQFFSSIIARTS
jgi:hypothetical protein